VAQTFATSILDATGAFTIGATVDGAPAFGAELDWAHFSEGTFYMTDAKAAEVIAKLEARHGRDYTP
jgi:hypothetical protein